MIRKVDHLGIAVTNLDEALDFYETALGLEKGDVEEVASQKVRIAFLPVGELNVELLEGMEPDSPVAKFVASKGPGIHHVAMVVDDIDETLAALAAKGVRLINEQAVPGAHGKRVAFVHPKATGGVLLELCEGG